MEAQTTSTAVATDAGGWDGTLSRSPSLRARLLQQLLRLLLRPLLRRVHDLAHARRQLSRLDWRAPFRKGGDASLRGVPVRLVVPAGARRVVLYLHGGGFFMQASGLHLRFLQRLCSDLDAAGVLPAYRLSPEDPYPAALDDCCRTYEALLASGIPAAAILVAGESAGGTLSLALLMRLRDRGLPLPGGAVLISPGTDLAGIGRYASYAENRHSDALVPPEALPRIVEAYVAGRDPAHPEISPLHGRFEGLPPLHFVASSSEVLRDDSRLAAERALAAGVTVELQLWPGLMHAFPLFGGLPEAQVACAQIAAFARQHCQDSPELHLAPAFTGFNA
ncbi:MAG: alpha/beta hydrolase [Oceanococcaceae bacterium]